MGGASVTMALIDDGLVDELRLLVYPLIAGPGKELFATIARRHPVELKAAKPLPDGRVSMTYSMIK